jgi:hypothetical protein
VQTPASAGLGGSFAVDVNIAQGSDLYSLQLNLNFNPAVLQATDVFEGTFLPGGGAPFFIAGGSTTLPEPSRLTPTLCRGPAPECLAAAPIAVYFYCRSARN